VTPLERARAIWSELCTYGRFQLVQWGTAFTTYEDEGEKVEAELNKIAKRARERLIAEDPSWESLVDPCASVQRPNGSAEGESS
jgi:hypothetical protein